MQHPVYADGIPADVTDRASAASAGAAASRLGMPAPVQVLRGSAIGIQKLHKKRANDVTWTGSAEADVLLGLVGRMQLRSCGRRTDVRQGYGRQSADFSIHHIYRSRTTFSLVCDPSYEEDTADTEVLGERPIPIGLPDLDSPLGPYDLGWTTEGVTLPGSRIRFSIEGVDAAHIVANELGPLGSEPICLILACYGLDEHGEVLASEHDRCWRLTLLTDPVSNLLVVDKVASLPVWCKFCSARLIPTAWTCLTCEGFSACEACYEDEVRPVGHDKEHLFIYQDTQGKDDAV